MRLLHSLGFLPEGRTALVLTDNGREGRGVRAGRREGEGGQGGGSGGF